MKQHDTDSRQQVLAVYKTLWVLYLPPTLALLILASQSSQPAEFGTTALQFLPILPGAVAFVFTKSVTLAVVLTLALSVGLFRAHHAMLANLKLWWLLLALPAGLLGFGFAWALGTALLA